MTKAELIDNVAKSLKGQDISKKAVGDIVDSAIDEIKKAVKKDKRFSYPDFGTFTIRKRAARKGRNPKTGEEIKIGASKSVGFKPSPGFKKSL